MTALIDIYAGAGPDQHTLDVLYDLLKERPAEASISHREMPTPEQHRQFVTRRPYEAWYFIEAELRGGPPGVVGSIYLTRQREVGIFIFERFQRRGHATAALILLRMKHPGRILANVAPDNERSHAFFKAAGGRIISRTYEL